MDGYWCDIRMAVGRLEPLWKSPRSLRQQEGRESVPVPVLPLARIAQTTHLFYTLLGVPMALPPNLVLQVVALLKRRAPAPMRSPQMACSQP